MEEGPTGQLARGGIEALPEVGRVQSETPLVPRGPHTVDTRVSVFGRICLESSVEAPCRTGAAGGGVLWECAGLRVANVIAHVPPLDGEGGYWFQDPIENRWEIESDATTVSLPSPPCKAPCKVAHFLQWPHAAAPCSSLHGAPDPPLPCLAPSPHRAPRQKPTAPLTRRVRRGVQVRLLRDHTRLVADLIGDWGWAPPPRIPPGDPTKARLYFVPSNLQISLALQGPPPPPSPVCAVRPRGWAPGSAEKMRAGVLARAGMRAGVLARAGVSTDGAAPPDGFRLGVPTNLENIVEDFADDSRNSLLWLQAPKLALEARPAHAPPPARPARCQPRGGPLRRGR